jgi:hypothetical protein
MRHPFFNMTRLLLGEGESDFHPLENGDGLVVTLGPNTAFFDRPGRSVARWPGTKNVVRQSPHPIPDRSWLLNELNVFLLILCGGGDVKLNMIKTLGRQREVLLTAGEGNVVEKIDLVDMAKSGAPSLRFLQPAYLCSSASTVMRSTPCDASTMSWSRAPYVYETAPIENLDTPAFLCLSGRTMVWLERLEPGESQDFALGNVIAATTNLHAKLRPTSQCHPDDYKAIVFDAKRTKAHEELLTAARHPGNSGVAGKFREFRRSTKTLFESIRAREGFFVCEITNHSESPGFVYVQLNKSGFYGGSGLVGVAIKFLSALFRWTHFSLGR